MPRLPEHLQRRDGVYHFRMRVPDDLRATLGKREIRKSLKTSNLAEAKAAVAIQRFKANAEFQDARRKIAAPSTAADFIQETLTEADLWSLAVSWFVEKQKTDAELGPGDFREESRLQELAMLTNPDDTNASSSVRNLTRRFLSQRGIWLEPDSRSLRRIEALIHEGMIECDKRVIRRFMGATAADLSPKFEGIDETTHHLPRINCTLTELMARSIDAAKRRGNTKSKLKRQAHHRVLRELLTPDIQIRRITREEARRVCAAISRLPSNFTKRYPGMTVAQVLDRGADELGKPMSPATANDYIRAFSSLMDFAVAEHLLDRNPAEKLSVAADGVKAKQKRLPFSMDDLKRIFDAPLYRGCIDDGMGYSRAGPCRPRRGRFWVPLIGLFSGMRLNEICQLVEEDIVSIAGHDVFIIRPSDDGSRVVKTDAAERIIPIHPELKRLGFLAFVSERRKRSESGARLFPELTIASTNYASDNFSKWFARFLDHVGIDHPRKNFHSFRHCFRDALRASDVSLERTRLLGGWTSGGTDASYGGSQEIEAIALSAEIGKICYPGLQLDF